MSLREILENLIVANAKQEMRKNYGISYYEVDQALSAIKQKLLKGLPKKDCHIILVKEERFKCEKEKYCSKQYGCEHKRKNRVVSEMSEWIEKM